VVQYGSAGGVVCLITMMGSTCASEIVGRAPTRGSPNNPSSCLATSWLHHLATVVRNRRATADSEALIHASMIRARRLLRD